MTDDATDEPLDTPPEPGDLGEDTYWAAISKLPESQTLPPNAGKGGLDLTPFSNLAPAIMARIKAEDEASLPDFLKTPAANESAAPTPLPSSPFAPREASSGSDSRVILEVRDVASDKQLLTELRACVQSMAKQCLDLVKDAIDHKFFIYNSVRRALYRNQEP